ncbi:MAG: hypothetical protein PHR35_13245 [Kiritimatiellae bacterium]|nr:hypothetical protein [Kiritimatiellia bacterium]
MQTCGHTSSLPARPADATFGRRLCATLLACVLTSSLNAQSNVFAMPRLQPHQALLVQEFKRALQRGDYAAMESTCRAGTALLPVDPTWRYNLACALARQGRRDAALDALGEAVRLGFRDAAAIARDSDFAILRRHERFEKLLAEARRTQRDPIPGRPVIAPAPVGATAPISASNTAWNFDLGYFMTFFSMPTNPPSAAPAPPVALPGPAGEAIRTWQADGSAAGNRGDLYDNRDEGHSMLDLKLFPEMRPVVYDDEARQARVNGGVSQFLFNGVPTIGNSSTAQTSGPYWRSNPRRAYVDGRAVALMAIQYLRNQMYVYPQHRDYVAGGFGDVFPAATPYLVIAPGSSFTDQPILQALAATLAAFRPEVKAQLSRQGALMPVVQMLLRASQRGVTNRNDYLTRQAHPVVFDAARLDLLRMVTMAHEMRTNALPPVALMRKLDEPMAVPGRDFFDTTGNEGLFDTPAAIARVVRGMAYTRRIVVDASGSRDLHGAPLTWHWFVLQGDPDKIRFVPRRADNAIVEIEVDYHGGNFLVASNSPMRSSRVELALCVDNGVYFSPPALVTFYYLNNEIRQYASDGRIMSVDYAAAAGHYVDPYLSLPRRWRDLYLYDARRRLTGWTRHRGEVVEAFTADGARVLSRDALNRPAEARLVSYLPRATVSTNDALPEVVQVDGVETYKYRYDSDEDTIGKRVK